MRTLETTISSLGLGLLLSSVGACAPPVGPDQQEAGLEKSADQAGGLDEAGKLGNARSESLGPAQLDNAARHALLDAYRRCFDSCADESADERPACHNNCAAEVSAGSGDPTASACPRSCTKAFGSCLAPCSDGRSEADVTSCRMQCQALAETCIAGCN
jgi:hypothetical protein